MATLPNTKTVSYEEWLRMPETKGEEVVNGEIRQMPAPTWDHGEIIQMLARQFWRQVDDRDVKVRIAEFDLVIRRTPLSVRVPDMAVFQKATIIERDGRIHSAPQLVVEVHSPANIRWKREEKHSDYAALGIPEAWIVWQDKRAIEVFYLEDGELRRHALLTNGILKPLHFPDVQIDIAQIWPD